MVSLKMYPSHIESSRLTGASQCLSIPTWRMESLVCIIVSNAFKLNLQIEAVVLDSSEGRQPVNPLPLF